MRSHLLVTTGIMISVSPEKVTACQSSPALFDSGRSSFPVLSQFLSHRQQNGELLPIFAHTSRSLLHIAEQWALPLKRRYIEIRLKFRPTICNSCIDREPSPINDVSESAPHLQRKNVANDEQSD